MPTAIMSGTWQWKRALDASIDLYTGVKDEPVIDLQNINQPYLRIMDGVTPGGIKIDTDIVEGIAMPSILSPQNGATNLWNSPLITASHFISIQPNGTADSHAASYWEIATDSGFTNIVYNSGRDTANLTSIDLEAASVVLAYNTRHYIRMRHEGLLMGLSEWSPVVIFDTRIDIRNHHVTTISSSIGRDDDIFGWAAEISGDGSTIIAGIRWDDNEYGAHAGAVEVFQKDINGNWVLKQRIQHPKSIVNSEFGQQVLVNTDGSEIMINAYRDNTYPNDSRGIIYFYTYNPTTSLWEETQSLSDVTTVINHRFGIRMDLTADGQRIIAGAWGLNTNTGGGFILDKDAQGTWNITATLTPTEAVPYSYVGIDTTITKDGNTVYLGAYNEDIDAVDQGGLYIFTRNPTTNVWTQSQRISSPIPAAGDMFGIIQRASFDGSVLLCGKPFHAGGTSSGAAVYVRNASTGQYTLEQFIEPADTLPSSRFGWGTEVSPDGQTLYLGQSNYGQAGTPRYLPCLAVYQKVGGVWTEVDIYTVPLKIESSGFGYNPRLTADGKGLIVSAHYAYINGIKSGAIHVYE